jgi:hypothetical protein
MSLLFSGSWDGGIGVINPGVGFSLFRAVRGISPEFGGILDRLIRLSSPSVDLSVEGARSKLDFIYCRNAGTEITRHKRLRASR